MTKKLNPFDPDNFKNEHVMQFYRNRWKWLIALPDDEREQQLKIIREIEKSNRPSVDAADN